MAACTFAPFALDVRPDRTRVYLRIAGEVDLATAPAVQAALEDLLADGWRDIVADLREVTFFDSTGVLLLVRAAERAAAEGWGFGIVDGGPAVAQVLDLTGAGALLERVPSVHAP